MGNIKMEYSTTGLAILCMFGYGVVALLLERIRFDIMIAGCIVLGIFVLETFAYLFEKMLNG